jgi:hypothetical protein
MCVATSVGGALQSAVAHGAPPVRGKGTSPAGHDPAPPRPTPSGLRMRTPGTSDRRPPCHTSPKTPASNTCDDRLARCSDSFVPPTPRPSPFCASTTPARTSRSGSPTHSSSSPGPTASRAGPRCGGTWTWSDGSPARRTPCRRARTPPTSCCAWAACATAATAGPTRPAPSRCWPSARSCRARACTPQPPPATSPPRGRSSAATRLRPTARAARSAGSRCSTSPTRGSAVTRCPSRGCCSTTAPTRTRATSGRAPTRSRR